VGDEDHIRKTVENNAAGAAWLMPRLREVGLQPVETSTNFIYFELEEDANGFAKRMQAEGVIVRSLVPWSIPNGVRVTIGTPKQNERFVEALKKVLSEAEIPAK
jgi:histidinol-phosphate aminotransferase